MFEIIKGWLTAVMCCRRLVSERENWRQSAAMFARNAGFYRDIVFRVGDMLGPDARRADDGGQMDAVSALRVPEVLARVLHEKESQLQHAFRWIRLVCENYQVAKGVKLGEVSCQACEDHRKCPVYRAHQSFEETRN